MRAKKDAHRGRHLRLNPEPSFSCGVIRAYADIVLRRSLATFTRNAEQTVLEQEVMASGDSDLLSSQVSSMLASFGIVSNHYVYLINR